MWCVSCLALKSSGSCSAPAPSSADSRAALAKAFSKAFCTGSAMTNKHLKLKRLPAQVWLQNQRFPQFYGLWPVWWISGGRGVMVVHARIWAFTVVHAHSRYFHGFFTHPVLCIFPSISPFSHYFEHHFTREAQISPNLAAVRFFSELALIAIQHR